MRSRVVVCLLALVALLALPVLPASPAGPPASAAPAPASRGAGGGEPPPAPIPVRIGVPTLDNLQFMNFWIARGAGYFEDEGLAVQLVAPSVPGQIQQLLLQGQVDAAVMQAPLYLGLIGQQQPVKLFANLLINDPINLIVDRGVADALDLSTDVPVAERLEAIQGLRIGVADEASNRLRVLLESVGMDPDEDVQIVLLHGEEQIPALTGGTVDALYTHTPFLEEALVDHDAFMLVDQSSGEVPELADLEVHTMVTRQATIDTNPAALTRVTRALFRAQRLVRLDPDAAVDAVMASGVPGLIEPRVEAIVDVYRPAIAGTPLVSPTRVVRTSELWEGRPVAPDFTVIDVHDFITSRFAREAIWSGW
jgi:NitT/TauT family transport system substrate-binding protein